MMRDAQPMPAQLTPMRSGGPAEAAASTAACTEASSDTSVPTKVPPSSSARALPRSALRSAMVTVAPAPARARAVASPSPEAPPETIAPAPLMSTGGLSPVIRLGAGNRVAAAALPRRALHQDLEAHEGLVPRAVGAPQPPEAAPHLDHEPGPQVVGAHPVGVD